MGSFSSKLEGLLLLGVLNSNTIGFWVQMDAIAVPNNTLVVAYNDSPNKRSPLRLGTSTDGGLTWTKGALIEDDPEGSFHYPALQYDAKKVGTAVIPPFSSVPLTCLVCASWHVRYMRRHARRHMMPFSALPTTSMQA